MRNDWKKADLIRDHIKWLDWRILQEENKQFQQNKRLLAGLKQRRQLCLNQLELAGALLRKQESLPDLAHLFVIGETLVAARIAARITQTHLAKLVGWDRQQIQRYEKNGYAECSVRRIQDVAAALISVCPHLDSAPPNPEAEHLPSALQPVRLPVLPDVAESKQTAAGTESYTD